MTMSQEHSRARLRRPRRAKPVYSRTRSAFAEPSPALLPVHVNSPWVGACPGRHAFDGWRLGVEVDEKSGLSGFGAGQDALGKR